MHWDCFIGELSDAIEHLSRAYYVYQGKMDYDAYRVEQGEVVFFNQDKIGTDNVQDCVTVIVRDPKTCRTALAHIDISVNPNALKTDVLDKFTKGKLDVYLLGGRYEEQSAKENIEKVVTALLADKRHEINIKTSDIGTNKDFPSAIVFNPVNGELIQAVPAKCTSDKAERQCNLVFGGSNKNLYQAFDTERQTNTPLILTEDQKKFIVKKP